MRWWSRVHRVTFVVLWPDAHIVNKRARLIIVVHV